MLPTSPVATRWSLNKLANLSALHSETARRLLQDVANRLAQQQLRLEREVQPAQYAALKHWNHLHYLHQDTERLCRQLLSSSVVLERWSESDQSIVSQTFQQVRDRHAISMERYLELLFSLEKENENPRLPESALQTILQARWGIQLLCDHYVKLYQGRRHGAVSIDCPVGDVVQDTVTEASHICHVHWLSEPEVVLNPANSASWPTVTTVRPWLHHALVELLKNAMHASLQAVMEQEDDRPPSVHVELSCTPDLVHVDICDQGTGLPQTNDPEYWFGLGTSTARQRWDRLQAQQSYAAVRMPMNSLGMGLPSSRMMMRQIGGNVTLNSNENGGCRARISLPRNDTQLEPDLERLSSTTRAKQEQRNEEK